MPPPRPASGDTIYIMYVYGLVTITVCPCWPASTTNQSGLVTLTFDLESGVRVTCDVGYHCTKFSIPRPLFSSYTHSPNVCDRQTDVRQKHRLMPCLLGAWHNNWPAKL